MRIPQPLCTAAVVLALLGAGGLLRAQSADPAATMLEDAIQKQWVTGDLAAAIRQYELILSKYGNQRRVASQALWRLGQSQEQLGRMDDARMSYQRLIREHPDQPALLEAARTRLTRLAEEEEEWSEPELGRSVQVEPEYPAYFTNQGGRVVFSDLSVYDPNAGESGETRRLLTEARSAAYPVLSPNGQQIVYLSWGDDLRDPRRRNARPFVSLDGLDGVTTRSTAELRMVGIGGGNDRLLYRGQGVRWLRPFSWSADSGAVLILLERTSGVRQMAMVNVRTGTARELKTMPYLSVQDMSLSSDGHFAAYRVPAPRGTAQYEFWVLPASDQTASVPDRRVALTLNAQRGLRVADDELVVHVLNRIGFGPRPGDIERVRAMGVDAYIDEQLQPEKIVDAAVDEKIGHFRSLKMEIPELLEQAGPPVAIAERRRTTMFQRPAFVARQEADAKTPDAALAGRAMSDPRLQMALDRPLDLESQTARIVRAVHSRRQLNEVVVDFWMNHFNVNMGDEILVPSFEEQVIRHHAFGKFENLLLAVAKHPLMLNYLDNWRSSAPAEVIEKRLAEAKQSADADGQVAILERRAFLAQSKGLNENFARELLELHSMGVNSGYTQKDIIEVAKILSGWTIGTRGFVNAREEDGVFLFDPLMHVDGDKVVLGQTFKSGGVEEGEALIRMLANRPETARFIATKLARRFISDTPPQTVIDEASRTYQRTGGDLREVLRTILKSPQFRASEALRVKIKKPFEYVTSALRASNASFEDLEAYIALIMAPRSYVSRMGEKLYNYEAPDGNPDVGAAWMNSNALLLRLEFVNALTSNRLRGITADLAAAEALLTQLGVPRPTPLQIEQHRAMLQAATTPAPAPAMGGQPAMMMTTPAAGPADKTGPTINPAAITVAAMLGSPQFQKR